MCELTSVELEAVSGGAAHPVSPPPVCGGQRRRFVREGVFERIVLRSSAIRADRPRGAALVAQGQPDCGAFRNHGGDCDAERRAADLPAAPASAR